MSSYYIAAKSELVEFFDKLDDPHVSIYDVTGVTVHTTKGDVKIPVFEYAEVEDA